MNLKFYRIGQIIKYYTSIVISTIWTVKEEGRGNSVLNKKIRIKILVSGVTEGSRYGENNRPTPIQMDRQKLKNTQNKLVQETMKTRQISWSNLCSFGFFLWGIIPKHYFVFASLGANNPVSLLCFLSWIGLNVLFFLGCRKQFTFVPLIV